jgi:hypothetical protein
MDKIISKTSKNDQCKLLQLLADSISRPLLVQYEFTHALNEFIKLHPDDKLKEINVWINCMQDIINEEKMKDSVK